MQRLEVVKTSSDSREVGSRGEGLQTFNCTDIAGLVLGAECSPRRIQR